MLRYICILFFLILGIEFAVAKCKCGYSRLNYDCSVALDSGFRLHWTLRGSTVRLALEVCTTGWVGISFPIHSGHPTPADVMIGWFDYSGVVVTPYYLATNAIDPLDKDFGVRLTHVNGIEKENKTVVEFNRGLYEGRALVDPEKPTMINFGYGIEDKAEYYDVKGNATICFSMKRQKNQNRKLFEHFEEAEFHEDKTRMGC